MTLSKSDATTGRTVASVKQSNLSDGNSTAVLAQVLRDIGIKVRKEGVVHFCDCPACGGIELLNFDEAELVCVAGCTTQAIVRVLERRLRGAAQ